MLLSLFAARVLTADVNAIMPVGNFLTKTFFGNEITSTTKYVDIVVKKGGRKMAPFVSPLIAGKPIKSKGKTLTTYEPPLLKPKDTYMAEEIFTTQTAFYAEDKSPEARAVENMQEKLADLRDGIDRRIEWMSAQTILDGKIVVKGDGVEDEIDFMMPPSNTKVLTGAKLWTDDSSDPLKDLEDWQDEIYKESGLAPDTVVFGKDAYAAFKSNAKVIKAYETRRISVGELAPTQLDDGVKYVGYNTELNLEMYAYTEYIEDENGDTVELIPSNRLVMGSKSSRTGAHVAFAGIADAKVIREMGGSATIFAGKILAKAWEQEDPSGITTLLQSKPLTIPVRADAFLNAKVV